MVKLLQSLAATQFLQVLLFESKQPEKLNSLKNVQSGSWILTQQLPMLGEASGPDNILPQREAPTNQVN